MSRSTSALYLTVPYVARSCLLVRKGISGVAPSANFCATYQRPEATPGPGGAHATSDIQNFSTLRRTVTRHRLNLHSSLHPRNITNRIAKFVTAGNHERDDQDRIKRTKVEDRAGRIHAGSVHTNSLLGPSAAAHVTTLCQHEPPRLRPIQPQ